MRKFLYAVYCAALFVFAYQAYTLSTGKALTIIGLLTSHVSAVVLGLHVPVLLADCDPWNG